MTIDKMRAEFEAWYSEDGKWPKSVEKDGNGNYRLSQAASAWRTFQVATAIERERCIAAIEVLSRGRSEFDLDGDERITVYLDDARRSLGIRKGDAP